jgi:hypothetical protein
MRYRLRTLLIVLALGPMVLAYVGSYYFLSRRGYAYGDSAGLNDVLFFAPPDTDRDGKIHGRYLRLYLPLIVLERALGTGRHPHSGTRRLN